MPDDVAGQRDNLWISAPDPVDEPTDLHRRTGTFACKGLMGRRRSPDVLQATVPPAGRPVKLIFQRVLVVVLVIVLGRPERPAGRILVAIFSLRRPDASSACLLSSATFFCASSWTKMAVW